MTFQPDLCADIPDRRVGRLRISRELLADEPMAGELAHRPGEPGAHRLHLGNHPRPQRRDPQPSDAGIRDPPAVGQLPASTAAGRSPPHPVGHFIGMVGALLIPVLEGAPIDLTDVWDPGRVLEFDGIRRHV